MSITEKVIFMCIQSEVKRSAQADEPIPFFLDSSVESIDEINPKRMSLLTAEMDETVFFFFIDRLMQILQHEFRSSSWLDQMQRSKLSQLIINAVNMDSWRIKKGSNIKMKH